MQRIGGRYFSFFYHYLGYRIFVVLAASLLVGVMDGFGLAMFLPLLKMVAGEHSTSADGQMGSLSFLVQGLSQFGLTLTLTVVLLTMLLFFILKGIFRFIETSCRAIYRSFFIAKVRIENINALAKYSYQQFVTADAGRIQNTMSGEVERVSVAFFNWMQILQQSILVIVYATLAFLANPQFTLLVVAGGAVSIWMFRFLFTSTKKSSRRLTADNHVLQKLLIQQVAFFKYMRATGQSQIYSNKLSERVEHIEHSRQRMGLIDGVLTGVREPLMIGIVVVIILIQVNVLGGSLAPIILSILFFYRAMASVMGLQSAYNQFLSLSGSIENLQEFTEELNQQQESHGSLPYSGLKAVIELKHVSFAYHNTIIVQDINLTLKRNEVLALVGESGSGKTTIMNLLAGLLPATQGRMLIDGIDVRDIQLTHFQKRIGYITQEPVVFDDTIFNNVTFWAPRTTENLIQFKNALKLASIADFVSGLPDREDTRLGNNGINLSGGQKQRISIARELYKDVEFLFLDEATSALDSETERNIQESIEQLKGTYTILIIAHRLSTIRNADRVILLSKGQIQEQGTFDDLKQHSHSFRQMLEIQHI